MGIDFILVPVGMFIQFVFLFKRELLTDKKTEKWIWLISGILFVLGYVLSQSFLTVLRTLPFLMVPIMSMSIYRTLFWCFVKLFNEEPVDTYMSRDLGLMHAGIFNFLFWSIGLIVPIVISAKYLS